MSPAALQVKFMQQRTDICGIEVERGKSGWIRVASGDSGWMVDSATCLENLSL